MRSFSDTGYPGFYEKIVDGGYFRYLPALGGFYHYFCVFPHGRSLSCGLFRKSGGGRFSVEKDNYVLWKRVRPFFFDLTKGKNTPLSFRIVFRLAPHNVAKLLMQSGISLTAEDVDGLFLNIRFDENGLYCISGTSLRIFSLDKSLEHAWDAMLEKFFRKKEIPFC